MNAAPSDQNARLVRSAQVNNSTGSTQMSFPKVFEPRTFRARFATFWSDFIRANYRNPEEVSVAFGVTFQTALNWWNGANRPSGDVVALAGRRFMDFMEGRG
ncbi:hypothetical protein [Paracoccus sp. (in: a-proteobacteria)]|nr:hypothetical protein [Paracoccus sp. (in: a-proteobacteria)]